MPEQVAGWHALPIRAIGRIAVSKAALVGVQKLTPRNLHLEPFGMAALDDYLAIVLLLSGLRGIRIAVIRDLDSNSERTATQGFAVLVTAVEPGCESASFCHLCSQVEQCPLARAKLLTLDGVGSELLVKPSLPALNKTRLNVCPEFVMPISENSVPVTPLTTVL